MSVVKRSDGFTAIEMIALMGMIAALTLLVAPSIPRMLYSGKLEQTRHSIKEVIRLAQQQAITEETTYRFIWNIAQNRWEKYYYDGVQYVLETQEVLPEYITLVSTTFASNQLDIDRFGAPSAGGTLVLQDSSGTERQLTVTAGSGIVQLP